MKLKLHLLLFCPSTCYICDFFLFHIEIEDKCGWITGGGGGNGYVVPHPLSHYWGGGAVHVRICFNKTAIKPADCQILFYHTTRGLEWETVLCMIIAPSKGF